MVSSIKMAPLSTRQENRLGFGILFLILIANAFFLNYVAFRGFYLFDFGIFLDAAWRVASGQRPHIDFYFQVGPIHLYMLAPFIKIFGFSKTAILIHLVLVSSTVTLTTFLMARKKIVLPLALLAALLTATCYYANRPHPWYDQSAHLWGILGICLLVRTLPFSSPKTAFWMGAGSGLAAALALATKTNIGLAYGFVFFVTLLCSNERSSAVLGHFSGALLALISILALSGSPTGLIDDVVSYTGTRVGADNKGLAVLLSPKTWLKNFYWLPAVIVLAHQWLVRKWRWDLIALFFGVAFVSIFAMTTGSENYPAYIPLMGVYLALAFVIFADTNVAGLSTWSRKGHLVCFWFLILFTVCQIVFTVNFAYLRTTITRHPEKALFPYKTGDYQLKTEGFKGWRVHELAGKTIDLIAGYFAENVPKDESLLILSELYVIYGLTGRESYRGVTFHFMPGKLPAPGKQRQKVIQNIKENPPTWILLSKDKRFILNGITDDLELTHYILDHYDLDKAWGAHALVKKRGTGHNT